MPLLIMHGGRPAVAVANKTPTAANKSVVSTPAKDDTLTEILKKLTVIEQELGITPAQEPPTEEELIKRQMFAEKMQFAREQKRLEREQEAVEAEKRKKEFLKRMAKGKKKAARMRENGS